MSEPSSGDGGATAEAHGDNAEPLTAVRLKVRSRESSRFFHTLGRIRPILKFGGLLSFSLPFLLGYWFGIVGVFTGCGVIAIFTLLLTAKPSARWICSHCKEPLPPRMLYSCPSCGRRLASKFSEGQEDEGRAPVLFRKSERSGRILRMDERRDPHPDEDDSPGILRRGRSRRS